MPFKRFGAALTAALSSVAKKGRDASWRKADTTQVPVRKPTCPPRRLTADITPGLRGRIKVAAFRRHVSVTDMLRVLAARETDESPRCRAPVGPSPGTSSAPIWDVGTRSLDHGDAVIGMQPTCRFPNIHPSKLSCVFHREDGPFDRIR
jgi:hypothetical protein